MSGKEKGSLGPLSEKMFKLLAGRSSSGLSVKQFCKKHGLSEPSYYYWQKKYKASCSDLSKTAEGFRVEDKLLHFNRVRKYLIDLAYIAVTVTYEKLTRDCEIPNTSPDRSSNYYLNNLLWDIDSFEYIFDRPPITSLADSYYGIRPGKGFYDWARLRIAHTSKMIEFHSTFLQEMRDKCCEFWQNEENYKLYSGTVHVEYK